MTAQRVLGVVAGLLIGASAAAGPAHADSYAKLDNVAVQPSPTCGGTASAEAQVAPVQIGDRAEDGVRVAVSYDAGVYDGSCALPVTVTWKNLATGAGGSEQITAVSKKDGHYGFVGYASTTLATGAGPVVVTLSSHPGQELRVNP